MTKDRLGRHLETSETLTKKDYLNFDFIKTSKFYLSRLIHLLEELEIISMYPKLKDTKAGLLATRQRLEKTISEIQKL